MHGVSVLDFEIVNERQQEAFNHEYGKVLKDFDYKPQKVPIRSLDSEVRAAFDKIIKIKNITVDVCGKWLWISGNTSKHKDELKEIGCLYHKKKGVWYWRPKTARSRKRTGGKNLCVINKNYRSAHINTDKRENN